MYFISAVIILYLLFLGNLIYFRRQPVRGKMRRKKAVFISVVIPARNEPHLHLLLNDLNQQTLTCDHYEIIVVDDHSEQKIKPLENGERLFHQKEGVYGKKAALTCGIEKAEGNVVTTVDADCRVGKEFMEDIYQLFSKRDIVLSPGLVRYWPVTNLFGRMQALENLALMAAGVAFHNMGMTSLSNGANLAFTREVWQEAGGYEKHRHIASGDDEFFVQEVANKYPEKVAFRTGFKSVVSTTPAGSFNSFINQRLRWAGKWRNYKNLRMQLMAVVVFLFHLIICGGLILLFADFPGILLVLFLAKFLLEGYLTRSMAKNLKVSFYPVAFLFLQVVYSPYVVFIGLAANFVSYKWKDRRYNC